LGGIASEVVSDSIILKIEEPAINGKMTKEELLGKIIEALKQLIQLYNQLIQRLGR